jgi:hypothetical protein
MITPKPDCIIPNLYLSGVDVAHEKELLQTHGIKHILVIGSELDTLFPDDFEYKHFKLDDTPFADIGAHFEEAHCFIKQGIDNGGCLVHWYNIFIYIAFKVFLEVPLWL